METVLLVVLFSVPTMDKPSLTGATANPNLVPTGTQFDLAIEGQGFFSVALPSGENAYTRQGRFHLDGDGNIVTKEAYVLQPHITVPASSVSVAIASDGQVLTLLPDQKMPVCIGQIILCRFSNPRGLSEIQGLYFKETEASGGPTAGNPGDEGVGKLRQGFIERRPKE